MKRNYEPPEIMGFYMDDSEILRLADIELDAFFDQLFPNGFAGEDVLNEIAPEGWKYSPLLS